MIRWFLSVIVLCVLLFGSVFGFNIFKAQKIKEVMASLPEPEAPVEVLTINAGQWRPSIHAIGYVEPSRGVDVTTSVAGLVDSLHFESGERVKKNQSLVSLESSVEVANLRAAEARLASAKSTLSRNQRLYEQKVIAAEAIDTTDSAYKVALAEVASARAVIERLEIKAPFDGLMGIRQVQVGQYVKPGDVIANLESRDEMRVRFTVPQKILPLLKLDMPMELHSDVYPNETFVGTINAIEPSIDKDSGVIQVQATIPNKEQKLRSGMYATLTIWQPEQSNIIVIPQRAINFTLYGEQVYVVAPQKGKDGKEVLRVQQKAITVGERRGDDAVVTQGLQAGEMLVISGQVRLDNGTRVKIVKNEFVDNSGVIKKD